MINWEQRQFTRDESKNNRIRELRHTTFDALAKDIVDGHCLTIIDHTLPGYTHQKIIVLWHQHYTRSIPSYRDHTTKTITLITAFPNRKLHAFYLS